MQRPARPRRRGFTLVELFIVITIIGILIALLLPAINGARQNARAAQVRTEIDAVGQAIAQFNADHGMNPPSAIILLEDGSSPWDNRSRAFLRRMWPQFDFTYSWASGNTIDLDRDGMAGEADPDGDGIPGITLTGAECLTFFLGGRLDPNGIPTGFSTNPAAPFALGGNRDAPHYTFDVSRFTDLDGDGMPEVKDPLSGQSTPYLYVSSYDGRGYNVPTEISGAMLDIYRQADQATYLNAPTDPTMPGNRYTFPAWKANSYQIISPGFDGEFGPGGVFNRDTADLDLVNADHDGSGTVEPDEMRQSERDNITNFNANMLAP